MPTEITITAYKFNELNDRAKEKARAWYMEHCVNDHEWWDSVVSEAKQKGADKGFDIEDIRFSGFWSQGDGAHWTGRIDMVAFLANNLDERSAWYAEDVILLALWEDRSQWIDRYVRVSNRSYRYSHSGGMCIDEYANNVLDLDADDDAVLGHGALAGASIYQLKESFDYEQRVNEWCDEALIQAKAYADDIYSQLEKEYEWYTTDEYIACLSDANEWLFNEKGELI